MSGDPRLMSRQVFLEEQATGLRGQIVSALTTDKDLAIIKAPPGSGKTYNLLQITAELISSKSWKVAVAAQTNNQANDLVDEFTRMFPALMVTRVGASGSNPPEGFHSDALWVTSTSGIPDGPGLVIATSSKWASSNSAPIFDLLAVDEAWQMPWADLMRCSGISRKFMLIGDPGQIAPVTTVDIARWGTSLRPPHKAAPEVVFDDPQFDSTMIVGSLPSCRRLPAEAVSFVKPFYDFDFEAFAAPGERIFLPGEKATNSSSSELFLKLSDCQPVLVTIPTPDEGPPNHVDSEIALVIQKIVVDLMSSGAKIAHIPGMTLREVREDDIGITSPHRAMNGAIRKALGENHQHVRIDTPERWEGLQKPLMIAVHPLSGVTEPSEFDLATGRLCVMASRQQLACIFVSRDHVGKTIENVIPSATQAPGQADSIGKGRRAHLEFWEMLNSCERVGLYLRRRRRETNRPYIAMAAFHRMWLRLKFLLFYAFNGLNNSFNSRLASSI